MQDVVAGKRSRGKQRQRWEKDTTDTFGTMAAASRVAEDRHQFLRRHLGSDVLMRICSERACETVNQLQYKAPDGLAGLRCPHAATRYRLEDLNIEI